MLIEFETEVVMVLINLETLRDDAEDPFPDQSSPEWVLGVLIGEVLRISQLSKWNENVTEG